MYDTTISSMSIQLSYICTEAVKCRVTEIYCNIMSDDRPFYVLREDCTKSTVDFSQHHRLSIFSRPQLPVTSPDINIYREETKYEEDKEMS